MIYRKEVDGFNWVLNTSDGGIGSTLYNANTPGKDYKFARENMFMQLLDTTVREGMTCIDLGANIGYATMFMLRNVGDSGTVYAIEPDPHNLRLLKINLAENGFNVKCEKTQCLITNKDGKSEFWIARHPNLNSVRKTKHSIRREVIDCFTLETFCSTRKYPNFIKMDIEGHEVKVFESGYEYFKNNEGETHFLLEVHPQYYDKNNNFAKILNKYYDIGFKIKYLIGTPSKTLPPFRDAGYKPTKQVESDGWVRSLYENIPQKDAIKFTCNLFDDVHGSKVVRSIMVSRRE
tara:strand:- start:3273 stop:4145 length:873 start_codon:yes stop_codon:yes gene_type:complete